MNRASISQDGSRLLAITSAGPRPMLQCWDLAQRVPLCSIPLLAGNTMDRLSPDGRFAAAVYTGRIGIWRTESGEAVLDTPKSGYLAQDLIFSPDSRRLLYSYSRQTHVFDMKTLTSKDWDCPEATAAAFSPDSRVVALGHHDGARLYDAESGEARSAFFKHGGAIERVFFSPDGLLLATEAQNQTIQLWEVRTGQPVGDCCGTRPW